MVVRRGIVAVVLALATIWSASALPSPFFARLASPLSVSLGTAGILIVNNDPLAGSETTATHLTGGLTAGAVYPFGNSTVLTWEPNILLWRSWYYWTAAGKAVPTGIEDREVWLLGLYLDVPVTYTLALNPRMDFTASLGLSLDLRLGIKADTSVSDSTASSINTYLWSNLRFITPTTAAGLRLRINDKLTGILGLKAWWPLADLWSGEGRGILDQAMINLNVAVGWRPGRRTPSD